MPTSVRTSTRRKNLSATPNPTRTNPTVLRPQPPPAHRTTSFGFPLSSPTLSPPFSLTHLYPNSSQIPARRSSDEWLSQHESGKLSSKTPMKRSLRLLRFRPKRKKRTMTGRSTTPSNFHWGGMGNLSPTGCISCTVLASPSAVSCVVILCTWVGKRMIDISRSRGMLSG